MAESTVSGNIISNHLHIATPSTACFHYLEKRATSSWQHRQESRQIRCHVVSAVVEYAHGKASIPATSTMNSVTTLMTPHAWQGFNPSNINHELCHYTDDAACMARLQSQQPRESQ